MAADISTMSAILKDAYGDYVRSFNDQCFIWDNALAGGKDSFVGLRAVHYISTKRTNGIGARADGDPLPTAGNQLGKRVSIPMRRTYGRIQLSRPLMKQAIGGNGSFADELDVEMEGCRKDYVRDICRQVWGQSNGVIARCASNSTVTVTLHSSATEYEVSQIFSDGGMRVDIGTVADPDYAASGVEVTDHGGSSGAYTITLATAPIQSVTSSHYVFRHGAGGATDDSGNDNDGQREITGLQTAVSATTTLHTLSVSNGSKQWQSIVNDNSGTTRPVTETLLMKVAMEASNKSGFDVDGAFCNRGVMLALIAMLIASKRHTVPISGENTRLKLQAGAGGIVLNIPAWGANSSGMLPVFADRDCPGNSLYGIHFGSIKKYQLTEPEWVDDDGAILSRVSGYDAFEAYLAGYQELGYVRRNAHWKIADLTEASS